MFNYMMMIPFTISAGYNFKMTSGLFIIPELSAGIMLTMMNYDPGYKSNGLDTPEYSTYSSVSPAITADFTVKYSPFKTFDFSINPVYAMIAERSPVHFLSINLSVSKKF